MVCMRMHGYMRDYVVRSTRVLRQITRLQRATPDNSLHQNSHEWAGDMRHLINKVRDQQGLACHTKTGPPKKWSGWTNFDGKFSPPDQNWHQNWSPRTTFGNTIVAKNCPLCKFGPRGSNFSSKMVGGPFLAAKIGLPSWNWGISNENNDSMRLFHSCNFPTLHATWRFYEWSFSNI